MFEILIAHGIILSIVIDKFHLDSFWLIEISTNLSLHRQNVDIDSDIRIH